MALALIKLAKYRNNELCYFLDYISNDVAKLNTEVQGSEHEDYEWSFYDIVKVYEAHNEH